MDQLKRRTMTWAVTLRVNPMLIRVQEMRRKWGSCSSAGTITLASALPKQDPRFQDYVIVHELLHLRYPNHGRIFKAMMSAHVPGWQEFDCGRNDASAASPSAIGRQTDPKESNAAGPQLTPLRERDPRFVENPVMR